MGAVRAQQFSRHLLPRGGAVNGLQELVAGRLHYPGDAGFAAATAPFNKRYADVRPAAALSVRDAADVSRALVWARECGVSIVPRGGGHSYAGYSTGTGLVLDLRALDRIRVDADAGLVTVGGGARGGAMYAALERSNLAFPLGNSDEVGIGGLTLGGGVAAVSRAFGLTCDTLVETEIVLADGSIRVCNATENADLFWACRGGGGGNFGVNTSFTFQAVEPRPSSTVLLLWEWRYAREVLAAMQEVMAAAPDEFAARIGAARAGNDPALVSVVGQHLGPATELRELLAPALATAPPLRCAIEDATYWEAKEFLHHETSGDPFAVRTRTTPKPLAEAGVEAIVAAVDRWPGSGNPDGGGVALFTWGGAINRIPVSDTAFPHRDVLFLISMDTSWSTTDPAHTVWSNLEWLDGLHEEMAAHATPSSYLNFTDPSLTDWRTAYYGPNHTRLAQIKRRYDPHRVFDFPQAV
ncbi:FAD-binding oxidoreductase [Nocardia terpenica]|nr:FAD-binding oxidoreductase [Nocardia terpenica]MBF6102706.1 FAD-binding oxidoreductase [Nocardia terpenica]MBF6111103.1 FAD-binding oxidoreductase [Nocardia terpenica]MBF6117234.1 FAD-binding oxidoreductase [Nocardia terpenica]MBF6150925.1 FAD-binding oxidoreductase [Nocardia terpenica]